ncbi:SubName: Full=Related to MRPL17-mitochondrial ribosomal protein, large subunit {ECO:0000313/EMBL:CCA68916.1} [Serendipita indica DSM 11827]|uniref:Large ribosomal subunit protein mL46 n=1 Tax=Serendipita indica (strain DSM 11827) TaxID=1109443 RepID=G4TC73_SERID|nr:SubName: Full=Related to MRPL17-mitochondrial ribosomal protein, large subunit {ECO:0000313/EMBL:CCA68916.1} [Serendipita indica DSM 11827]CCA68916.1 related to MRPL17-mitochondrial ribosomal protein, large subunit [Serendipita indica DSM 11827]
MLLELFHLSQRCLARPNVYSQRTALRFRTLATEASNKTTRIVAATILNRAPFLTPTPDPFEQAYYDYQARLARAISSPLPTDVYFKPGSLLERRFALEERQREKAAFGEDFTPIISLPVDEDGKGGGKSLADQLAEEAGLEEPPQPRIHRADKEKDVKSLDRAGERNLYLLVKKDRKANSWQFPQGGLENDEALHKAALRELKEECGPNMDVWMVGRQPIGHYAYEYPTESQRDGHLGAKVYFFKGHILAGQCRPDGKEVVDFAWLTKEEVQQYVEPHYWTAIKDMLSDS